MFRPTRRPMIPALLLLALACALAACGSGAQAPIRSFDPASACTTDGQMPGAYPELEALLPQAWDGAAPANKDSGRTCTKEGLGTLAGHGITEVRYAGATWPKGGSNGLTVAIFEADGLDAAKLIEFYADGARTARRTDTFQVTEVPVGTTQGRRLDVLGTDGSGQTIVTWPAAEPGRVNVLLAANIGDTAVAQALETLAPR